MASVIDSEKRCKVRHETVKSATIIIDGASAIKVVICDLSDSGARLVVPAYENFPSTFELVIEHQALRVLVRKCWQSAQNMGVKFISAENAGEPTKGISQSDRIDIDHTKRKEDSRDGQCRSQAPEAAIPGYLIPEYDMAFNSVATEIGQSHCSIGVKLRNLGDTGAIYPFICLPALGFHVEPAQGWVANEIASVRKMIRLGAETELMLQPDTAVDCCNIILPFSPRDGGHVTFTSDIVYPFAQLPSILLTCQVGAANFPAERHTLTIPSSHIAGLILDHVLFDDAPWLATG